MCRKVNYKHNAKLRFLILTIFIVNVSACATTPPKTYEETVSQWKSYEDVDKWMRSNFSFDMQRAKESKGKPPVRRSPEETFKLKSGLCYDQAYFLKDVLNRIDPAYDARVIKVEVSPFPTFFHDFACSFENDDKLFIMHYGTMYKKLIGVHGPYNSLDEFKKYYEGNHPKVKEGLKVVRVIYIE